MTVNDKPRLQPSQEDIRNAVQLCNSGDILVTGRVAEARVAELLAMERQYTALEKQLEVIAGYRFETVPPLKNLDTVNVIWRDHGPGAGEVVITCYGSAWTGYWAAMGKENIREFFLTCDTSYLVNRLTSSEHWAGEEMQDRHDRYLSRIVEAIKKHIITTDQEAGVAQAAAG